MKYRSKPTECEAMQWMTGGGAFGIDHLVEGAKRIVAWVNANGGEARVGYEQLSGTPGDTQPYIAVRTINGWAYAAPGHYVVMGTAEFAGLNKLVTGVGPNIRDFYPVDPETFERRWQALAVTAPVPADAKITQLRAAVERCEALADRWGDVLRECSDVMTTAQRNAHDYDRLELLIAISGTTPPSLEDFRAALSEAGS